MPSSSYIRPAPRRRPRPHCRPSSQHLRNQGRQPRSLPSPCPDRLNQIQIESTRSIFRGVEVAAAVVVAEVAVVGVVRVSRMKKRFFQFLILDWVRAGAGNEVGWGRNGNRAAKPVQFSPVTCRQSTKSSFNLLLICELLFAFKLSWHTTQQVLIREQTDEHTKDHFDFSPLNEKPSLLCVLEHDRHPRRRQVPFVDHFHQDRLPARDRWHPVSDRNDRAQRPQPRGRPHKVRSRAGDRDGRHESESAKRPGPDFVLRGCREQDRLCDGFVVRSAAPAAGRNQFRGRRVFHCLHQIADKHPRKQRVRGGLPRRPVRVNSGIILVGFERRKHGGFRKQVHAEFHLKLVHGQPCRTADGTSRVIRDAKENRLEQLLLFFRNER
ncbi:hypothetical protein BC828DRAFT_63452 [Blastocladiella britannica]|nr:hypothetical protein BC828DRAFT_63452 [Blastocladiella britannica]